MLTISDDKTVRIWDAATGAQLAKLAGHTSWVLSAVWSQDESKVLTSSYDDTVLIWDGATGRQLVMLEEVDWATWSRDESKLLTISDDHIVRIWYTSMTDLLAAACTWTPRNLTQSEWGIYMEGNYHPTCANAPIPPEVIAAIKAEARAQIRSGQVVSATQRIDQLNNWLKANGQFNSFGVDKSVFVTEVAPTATTAALPSPTVTPTPSTTIDRPN